MLRRHLQGMISVLAKSWLVWLGLRIGPRLSKPEHCRWICERFTPLVLDKRVLKNGLVERPLTGVALLLELFDPSLERS